MKRIIIILGIIAVIANTCGQTNHNQNNTVMDEREKLDFELLDKFAEKDKKQDDKGSYVGYYWNFTENSIETQLFGDTRYGFTMRQTPPNPAFFQIYKQYYPNGYLKLKGKCMGGGATKIGEWEYYNENGELTSKVDEDKKFGKFGYNELLLFLHQQKHINIETGENREKVDFGYSIEKKQWGVYAINTYYWVTEYVIDGETGKVINKKEYQGGIE